MIKTDCTKNDNLFNVTDKSNKINSTNSLLLNGNIPLIQYQILNNESKENIDETSSIETYKDIQGYDGDYQISNLGNIKSLKKKDELVLSPSVDKTKGYLRVCLYKNSKRKSLYIHQLVAIAFLGHIPNGNLLVVDHINNDKTNNDANNLQVISNRENLSKDKWRHNPSSFYTGVCYHTTKKKWESSISVNGDSFHLGYFNNESKAGLEYKRALEHYNQYSDLTTYSIKTNRRNLYLTDVNQLTISFIQPY